MDQPGPWGPVSTPGMRYKVFVVLIFLYLFHSDRDGMGFEKPPGHQPMNAIDALNKQCMNARTNNSGRVSWRSPLIWWLIESDQTADCKHLLGSCFCQPHHQSLFDQVVTLSVSLYASIGHGIPPCNTPGSIKTHLKDARSIMNHHEPSWTATNPWKVFGGISAQAKPLDLQLLQLGPLHFFPNFGILTQLKLKLRNVPTLSIQV